MVCIYCDSKAKTAVVNSRVSARTGTTWRRRQCASCGSIITTREYVDYENALRVRKGNVLEPFLRDRLLVSVYNSLSHRKTALNDATELTDTVINSLLKLQTNGVLEKTAVIDAVQQVLGRFDQAAATHYKAHHGY